MTEELTTEELKRTWKLLSWREKGRAIWQYLAALFGGGAVPGFLGFGLDRLRGEHYHAWGETALNALAIGFGSFLAVWLLHARPLSRAWRRKRADANDR